MKVHFSYQLGCNVSACGVEWWQDVKVTDRRNRVTCKRCKRTRRFRKIK